MDIKNGGMKMKYDVIVIGSGAGGYYSAISCAERGLKTALIEKGEMGGTAFRWGSLAVKRVLDAFRGVDEDFLKEVGKDPEEYYRREYFKRIEEMPMIERKLLTNLTRAGVEVYYGDAEAGGMEGEYRRVEAGGRTICGKNIVVATGTTGRTLWKGERIVTHKELLAMKEVPEKICIVGGSVEGIELANISSYMGIETVVIEAEDEILMGTERDLVKPVEENLKNRGVRFLLGRRVEECVEAEGKVRVILNDALEEEVPLVVVTGLRDPNIPKGLTVGTKEGYATVDKNYETTERRVYAVGDINGIMGMANAARYQGEQM